MTQSNVLWRTNLPANSSTNLQFYSAYQPEYQYLHNLNCYPSWTILTLNPSNWSFFKKNITMDLTSKVTLAIYHGTCQFTLLLLLDYFQNIISVVKWDNVLIQRVQLSSFKSGWWHGLARRPTSFHYFCKFQIKLPVCAVSTTVASFANNWIANLPTCKCCGVHLPSYPEPTHNPTKLPMTYQIFDMWACSAILVIFRKITTAPNLIATWFAISFYAQLILE